MRRRIVQSETGRFTHAQRALAMGRVAELVPDDHLEASAQPWIGDLLHAPPWACG